MEHLREYQDYLLAYRLRALVGGSLRPTNKLLSLPQYAQRRLERQTLAKNLLAKANYHADMQKVERITDELNFGFWHNPSETIRIFKRIIEMGGCKALESPEAFIRELLTRREREVLGKQEDLVARYYLGLFRASAAYLDAEVFTRLRSEVDPLRDYLPVFILPDTEAEVTTAA
ncbi:MAG: hypothetical protein ACRCYY_12975 [Trueperaceae bacterium]